MPPFARFAVLIGTSLSLATVAYAATGRVNITQTSQQVCVDSNGLPDHATGTFPNRGNPHRIKRQDTRVCIPRAPVKGAVARPVRVTGIAENGILIRPGTADWYDASTRRGHSRNSASGWNLDGMGARALLGLDQNNAHVDHRGLYHYHGVPRPVVATSADTRIGWAADGFEIHYVADQARSSYMLKGGTRPSAPGGAYDGTYNQDWEYVRGTGNLDDCNGATVNGQYMYFATDHYPFFPRCLYGTQITNIR